MDKAYIHLFIGQEMDHVAGTSVRHSEAHQDKQDIVPLPKAFQLVNKALVHTYSRN